MASIHREILVDVPAATLWDAMRDPGALHTHLVPAFVIECRLDGNTSGEQARELRFTNGMTVRELIIDIDDDRRRIAWSAVGGRLTHHNASTQIFDLGDTRCRVVWIADLLPHALAPAIATMIEAGLQAMKAHAEKGPPL
ncbi:polyketide cyclase [Pelomonas sp. Root1217]|uniref:SRPBCC family protein n=1 Tax=Pelomonas sp. Root1217 TaxID=1736430 RepID=UPI00070A3CD6|nr:SRPBCC family protein [Pelomonas sp. Root1217]KQV53508.1 polyketide cyclase [Pelomonas sp. Root1217]